MSTLKFIEYSQAETLRDTHSQLTQKTLTVEKNKNYEWTFFR